MKESKANERQVSGAHYEATIQHWDYAFENGFDYFQGQITKYIHRWKYKNGIDDLLKAQHFLEKYIELQMQQAQAQVQADNNPITGKVTTGAATPAYTRQGQP